MAQVTQPILIKQYAGGRLYDTAGASYVSLENIAGLLRSRRTVIVQDAKTGEDITSATLTRLIAGGL